MYSWAGKVRTVNISKDEVFFASVEYLASSLKEFDDTFRRVILKSSSTKKQVAEILAEIHCELNAIHPFREGNGRTIRLFLDLIASSNGYNPIDWSRRSQASYIKACIDGMSKKYDRMERIIFAGLTK